MVLQLVPLFEALSRVMVWSCAIRQSGSPTILSNGQKKTYLWTFLIHNSNAVAKPHKILSQVYATVLAWYRLKSYHFQSQLPYTLLDINPVSRHTKKCSFCIVCCPSITRCCNFPWCSLYMWQFGKLQFNAGVTFNSLWSVSSAASTARWTDCEYTQIHHVLLVSPVWLFLVSWWQDNF